MAKISSMMDEEMMNARITRGFSLEDDIPFRDLSIANLCMDLYTGNNNANSLAGLKRLAL